MDDVLDEAPQRDKSGGSPAGSTDYAIEARGLVKRFGGTLAVNGVDLTVPRGAIYGILGPNGAGKTTTLRMILGIIDPDEGVRRIFGEDRPQRIARRIGYLPEERGLYPAMKAPDAIAFMGSLRGLPRAEGRKRGIAMMEEYGLGHAVDKKIKELSKGMAQTVIFSTHVIHHAERLCSDVAIIAGGKVPYAGSVEVARDRLPPQVRLETQNEDGPWRAALPDTARRDGAAWVFEVPDTGIEPLLRSLIEGNAGIRSLSIERAGLHDAFVTIAGEAAAKAMQADATAQEIPA